MSDPEPAPRKLTLGKKAFERINPPADAATPAAEAPDVTAILKANLARERATQPEVLPDLRERRTGRRRDYLLAAAAGNLLGVAAALIVPGGFTVFLLAYFVMLNLALVWVMFVVMDKY